MSDCDCQTQAMREARDGTLRSSYLAGVRAGLKRAGEVARAVACEREEFRAQAEKSGMSISAGGFGHAAYAAGEIATAIAALDAEEVAGREDSTP